MIVLESSCSIKRFDADVFSSGIAPMNFNVNSKLLQSAGAENKRYQALKSDFCPPKFAGEHFVIGEG